MSVYENIQFFHRFEVEEYLEILKKECAAREHPKQRGAYLIGELEIPFYKPQFIENHTSILSFNYVPLSDVLIQALIHHPELAPETTVVLWLIENDLILKNTLGELRNIYARKPARIES